MSEVPGASAPRHLLLRLADYPILDICVLDFLRSGDPFVDAIGLALLPFHAGVDLTDDEYPFVKYPHWQGILPGPLPLPAAFSAG